MAYGELWPPSTQLSNRTVKSEVVPTIPVSYSNLVLQGPRSKVQGLPFPDSAQFMSFLLEKSISFLLPMFETFSLLGDCVVAVLFYLDQRIASVLLSEQESGKWWPEDGRWNIVCRVLRLPEVIQL